MKKLLVVLLSLLATPALAQISFPGGVSDPGPGSGGGSGTVNIGIGNQIGYYASSGTAISGNGGATLTGAGVLNATGIQNTALPTLTVLPTGNALSTTTSLNIQTSTAAASHETVRSFLATLGMVSGTTAGLAAQEGHVTLYTGMSCVHGTGNCWSINPLLTMEAGSSTGVGPSYTAQTLEIDTNNFDVDRPIGTSSPSYGVALSGAAPFGNTAALIVDGTLSNQWHAGIIILKATDYGIYEAANAAVGISVLGAPATGIQEAGATSIGIVEQSNAVTGFYMIGSHVNGINLASGTYSGNAFLSPGFGVDGSGNVTGLAFNTIPFVSNVEGTGTPGVDGGQFFFYQAPSVFATASPATLRVDRNAQYTGGTVGTVRDAIWAFHTVGTNVTNYEWSILGQLQNSATGGQNVAGYFSGEKMTTGTGPTWGIAANAFEAVVTNNPTSGTIGAEIDITASGGDSNSARVILDLVTVNSSFNGVVGTTPPVITYGIRLGPAFNNAATNGSFVNAIFLEGTSTNGVNLANATISGNAFSSPGFLVSGTGLVAVNGANNINPFQVLTSTDRQIRITDTGAAVELDATNKAQNAFQPVFIGGSITILHTGGTAGLSIDASQNVIFGHQATPANAGVACTANTFEFDASFLYVCTASGAWKRVAIATWP